MTYQPTKDFTHSGHEIVARVPYMRVAGGPEEDIIIADVSEVSAASYAVWYQNLLNGSCHTGGYCETLQQAVDELHDRMSRPGRRVEVGYAMEPRMKVEIRKMVESLMQNVPEIVADPDTGGSLTLTVATDDNFTTWRHQTGDNSFSGPVYGLPHWAVVELDEDSNPSTVVDDIIDQLEDLASQ